MARSYIDEALRIQMKFGEASETSDAKYVKAVADAETAFGHLAEAQRENSNGSGPIQQSKAGGLAHLPVSGV